MAKSDALQIVLSNDNGVLADAHAGLVGGTTQLTGKTAGISARITRDEKADSGAATLYRLTIPKALVGVQPFQLRLAVSDNDGFGLKQTLTLGDASGLRLRAR